jgi:hypothetical protein
MRLRIRFLEPLFHPGAVRCRKDEGDLVPNGFVNGGDTYQLISNLCIYRSSLASHLQVRHPAESFYAI